MTIRPAPAPGHARGNWWLRDRPGVFWLVLAVIMTFIHPFVPESRWLMVHLVFLGAITHSIMVWSTHFTQALLKTPPTLDDRRIQTRRLIMLLVGTSLTLIGVPTATWSLTVTGASLVSIAVLWHGIQLYRRLRKALPGRFRVTVRYYIAATCCLPVGAALGATLALGLSDHWHGRILLAHSMINVLGWVGLTVTGTLLTLWPTMLRTRISPEAEKRARQALPGFIYALLLLTGGVLLDIRQIVIGALIFYALAFLWWASALIGPLRAAPPREFAPASVSAALVWLSVGLGMVLVATAGAESWADISNNFGATAAVLAVGFAAQLLSGALSYLIPSVLGGGKTVVRAGAKWFDRWATARLSVTNLGLLLCLLPVPSLVRVIVSVLVVASLASFIPLMFGGIRAAVAAKKEVDAQTPEERAKALRAARAQAAEAASAGGGAATPDAMPSIWSGGQLVAAVSALTLAISLGVAGDPSVLGLTPSGVASGSGQAAQGVTPTGNTTTVEVEAHDMVFIPDSISVPAGDRLVIELVNADPTMVHDLQIMGQRTPRLNPGESATLDLGVVGESAHGWCTIVGHRQLGMTFDIVVEEAPDGQLAGGESDGAGTGTGSGEHSGHTPSSSSTELFMAQRHVVLDNTLPVEGVIDPELSRLPAADGPTRHQLTLTAQELELEVAPGVTQTRWTFNGQVPGPTLRGRVGDIFEITLVNDGTLGHSIDFHAGALAPDEPMRTIAPGESLVYTFTAERAGIWMYHCSTMPMTAHIAAGMHGAVIIEPAEGLPEVDKEYVLVQSETYLVPGTGQGEEPAAEVDTDAILAEQPTFVSFNGIANQYLRDQSPFTARVGERVRFWVLANGPNRGTAFHIVGGQFDTMYAEGAYLLGGPDGPAEGAGAQALGLHVAQGGFVELTFPEAGHYPVVNHVMVDAERGAMGTVVVTD